MARDTSDNLEKFVKNNKSEFDGLTPKDSVWEEIQKELVSSTKDTKKTIFWRAAAIILFIFSIGLTFYIKQDNLTNKNSKIVYSDDFLNTEKYYTAIINDRQQLIRTVAQTYPDIESEFESDWEKLDKSYKNIKDEYRKNQSEEILNALVQNLQHRVNLLNKQIEVLQAIKNKEKSTLEV